MTTIKDIARKAKVSQGTVSNVLNGRGNVSIEKINIVNKVAKELGYQANERAKMLRKGVSKKIAVLLPDIRFNGYSELYRELNKELQSNGYTLQLFLTQDIPEIEKKTIQKIEESVYDAVVLISSLADPEEFYQSRINKNTKLVFALRRPRMKCIYFGFEDERMGSDIADFCNERKYKTIGLFSNYLFYDNERCFTQALIKKLRVKNIAHTQAGYLEVEKSAFLLAGQELDAIITTDVYYTKALENAWYYSSAGNRPDIIEAAPSHILRNFHSIKYELDYNRLGNQIAGNILNDTDTVEYERILSNDGFFIPDKSSLKTNSSESLNILLVDNPTSKALSGIIPLFERETGIKVNLMMFSYDEAYEAIENFGKSGMYDIIRLDVAWLKWFAEDTLLPLNETGVDFTKSISEILPELYQEYCLVNGEHYSMPFDPSVQIMLYRKDLFEDPVVKRMFYEKHRKDLKIPQTFDELNESAEFFTRSYHTTSPTEYGLTIVSANTAMASCELLPRLFAYEKLDLYDTNQIKFNGLSGEKALQNYIESKKYCKTQYKWWDNAVEDFAEGDTAITIVFANYASEIISKQFSKVAGRIGYAPIPGKKPLLGGGVMGISKNCNKKKEAALFLEWVNKREISAMITYLGGMSANRYVYENSYILERYPWLAEVKEDFSYGYGRNSWIMKDKKIEERKIENILGLSIRNALEKNMDVKKALDCAQEAINQYIMSLY